MAEQALFAILEEGMETGLQRQGLLGGLVEIDLDLSEVSAYTPPQGTVSKSPFASAIEPPAAAYQKGF